MDNKLTDDEIIKALECCSKQNECKKECPLDNLDDFAFCFPTLLVNALDLINRKSAEIEELQEENKKFRKICDNAMKTYKETKAEVIKEYKERVKQILLDKGLYIVAAKTALNEAEKEMVGENDV